MKTYLVAPNLSAKTFDKGALARKDLLSSISVVKVDTRTHNARFGALSPIHHCLA